VAGAAQLSTASRDVADLLERDRPNAFARGSSDLDRGVADADDIALAGDLRLLASAVEDQTAEFRDRYLATAADLDAYHSILG